jgi:hypothetical protein
MDCRPCLHEVLVPLSAFLVDKDLAHLLLVNSSFSTEFQSALETLSSSVEDFKTCSDQGIGARILAARKLRFWWKRCRLIRWLNKTAKDASQKHLRPYLMQTNLVSLKSSLSAQISDRRYLSCRSWKALNPLCPECGLFEIRATLFYYQCCELMSRTIPFLYVGCQSCVNQKLPRLLLDNVCYTSDLEANLSLQSYLDSLS